MAGLEWAKSEYGLLWPKLSVKTVESNWARRSQLWAWVKLGLAHFDSESNWAKESIWVGTFISPLFPFVYFCYHTIAGGNYPDYTVRTHL